MAKIFEYVYDQKTSKSSYLNWLELVDQLVEGEELQQVVSHFQRHYELSRFGVSQHIKRWLCNCYDFENVKFLRNLEPHHLGISQARYLLILEYVLFFSGENKNKSQQFRLIIDGVESFSELEKAFSKVISIADVEIPLIFPGSPGSNEGKRTPLVYHCPSYRGYQRQLVKHAKMVEKRFGLNLYKEVSRSLGIDVFQIAISVINQYLYWHNVFSTVV